MLARIWNDQIHQSDPDESLREPVDNMLLHFPVLLICVLALGADTATQRDLDSGKCQQCLLHCAGFQQNILTQLLCQSCVQTYCSGRAAIVTQFLFSNYCKPYIPAISKSDNGPCCAARQNKTPEAQTVDPDLDEILEKYRSRFMLPGLLQREARYVRPSMMSYDRAPKTRSQSVQHERPVCPTTYEVIQPSFAEHMSGTRVSLWTYRGLRQFFHVGFCKFKQPPMQTTPPGTCKSIGILHKAIFLITKKQKEKEGSQFRNCSLISKRKGLYMCDDWIRLNASCALYV